MPNLGQIYDVDLKLLRCFCAIVEEQSFTAAQASLNMSSSTLSEYLKSLEVRLGTPLCRRGPKGFKLFKEGELVYRAAKELFRSIEVFKQSASNINQEAPYELTVAVQDGIVLNPRARIAEAIQRFSQAHPNVRFRIENMLGFRMTGQVAEGSIHLGIGLPDDQFRQLSYAPLFEEHAVLCCSPSHPLFAVPEERLSLEWIESVAYCNRGPYEVYHPERARTGAALGDTGLGTDAQLALILSGRNVGYVLEHDAQTYLDSGRLRALRPDLVRLTNRVGAITGPGFAEFKLGQRFLSCLIAEHREDPARSDVAAFPIPTQRGSVVMLDDHQPTRRRVETSIHT